MKRSYLVAFVLVASVALLVTLFSVLPRASNPVMAAPGSDRNPFQELRDVRYAPLYQGDQIECTVAVTTTDTLDNANACQVDQTVEFCAENRAVTLASYDGLALIAETGVPEGEEREVPVHEDWFRLDNADVGAIYTVEAIPDRTRNYNIGIVVYDQTYNEIGRDSDQIDNQSADVSFMADDAGPYFFQVFQITDDCSGRTYHLDVTKIEPTATPTSTPLPTIDEDAYEPNDNFEEAMAGGPTLPIQVPIALDLTFHSVGDVDYFRFYTKEGRWYQATTSDLNLVDTLIEIYNEGQDRIDRDDDSGGGLASRITWRAAYDGYYFIVVQNNVESAGSYDLTLDQITAPATATPGVSPTPGVGPTPRAQADQCERNPDFQGACIIPLNESQTFNFVPAFGEGPDNDFYKVWVKPGLHYQCRTSDLAPGVDPNMIVYNGPSWDQAIGGNDDIAPCNFNSCFNYLATYSGWLYLLVGTGERTPSDVFDSSYTLTCEKSTTPLFCTAGTPQPTSTPRRDGKLPTAEATIEPRVEPTREPTATPTVSQSPLVTPTPGVQELSIRALTTPTPPATPASRFVPISLLVYYDVNGDGEVGAGEGITGISAQAYELATGELLAQGFTDAQGRLSFTVSAQSAVRLTIPFLGFSHLIPWTATEEEASVRVRVPPQSVSRGTP